MPVLIPLQPYKKQALWGGCGMAADYGFGAPGEAIAEAWVVSAHPAGDCRVAAGPLAGQTLAQLWAAQPQLFGARAGGDFPLLIKLIDAAQDLSVQVHPDDAYAAAHEPPLAGAPCRGKYECWYVLRAAPGAKLVLGHHAATPAQLRRQAAAGDWAALLRTVPVRAGDFFSIPPGTVHAIGGGIRLLEVQQSSDVTYRLYDYGRLQDGRPRPLHLQKALDVAAAPCAPVAAAPCALPLRPQQGSAQLQGLPTAGHFTLRLLRLAGQVRLPAPARFAAVVVLEGEGAFNGLALRAGGACLVPCGTPLAVRGRLCAVLVAPAEG